MQIDTDKMAQQCINAINDKIKNLKTLNVNLVMMLELIFVIICILQL